MAPIRTRKNARSRQMTDLRMFDPSKVRQLFEEKDAEVERLTKERDAWVESDKAATLRAMNAEAAFVKINTEYDLLLKGFWAQECVECGKKKAEVARLWEAMAAAVSELGRAPFEVDRHIITINRAKAHLDAVIGFVHPAEAAQNGKPEAVASSDRMTSYLGANERNSMAGHKQAMRQDGPEKEVWCGCDGEGMAHKPGAEGFKCGGSK